MGQVEQVCEELDRVLVELMGSLKQLADARKKYCAAVSEGYFNMAKARYAMGHHAVGALQYDAVMTPLVHVETSNELALFDETGSNLEFRVERLQLGRKESPQETDSNGTELRRRRPGSGGQSSVEDVPVRGGESESVREVKDPLKWFGILVPQSLRHSQQYFIQAISHSAELATIQVNVELLRRRYSKLLVEKRGLKLTHQS